MACTSPRDLATAFATFSRRLVEARGENPCEESSPVERQVLDLCEIAGLELGVPFSALPDAIRARPADSWGRELVVLEGYAMHIGGLLRRIERLNPHPERDS